MKFTSLMNGIFIGLLLGCNKIDQDTTVRPTPEPNQSSESTITETTEFDSVSFPQDSCGEKLPNNPKFYPVKSYPVFIDYRENYLQIVKSKYCRDAIKKTRKKTGRDAIQVASFLTVERANQFKDFFKNKLGSGEVGEPTIIEAKPNQTVTSAYSKTPNLTDTTVQSNISVAKAAKLTPEQVEALQPLNDANNPNIPRFKILVPTYLPPGFKINKFEPYYDRNFKIGFDYSRGYTIEYKNLKSNVCFQIDGVGHPTGGGGDPGDYKTVEVSSPALGKVVLMYTEFSQYRQNSYVTFEGDFIFVGTHVYQFRSSSSDECNIISVQEAVKIVESFQWLNP